MSNSLQPYGLEPAWLLCPWDFPGKNTGVGCHFLLQGIFPTQGWNLSLLQWQAEPLGKPYEGVIVSELYDILIVMMVSQIHTSVKTQAERCSMGTVNCIQIIPQQSRQYNKR